MEHHHHHHHEVTSLNRAFIIGIVINALYVVCEAVFGFIYNSLGLLSDAGHNLGDCTSLVLAMLAFVVDPSRDRALHLRLPQVDGARFVAQRFDSARGGGSHNR